MCTQFTVHQFFLKQLLVGNKTIDNIELQLIQRIYIDINGFIIHDCTVSVLSFQVQNTKRGDNLCDRQQVSIGKCACYQIHNCNGNVVISVEIQIISPD